MQNKKQLIYAIIFSFIFAGLAFSQSIDVPEQGYQAIEEDTLYKHVAFLASDELRGRNTPSSGLDSAAAYIARYFQYCGLKPIEAADGYFQRVPLLKTKLAGKDSQKFILKINGISETRLLKNDFVPFYLSANRTVTAPVAFVGYGITAPEYNYDDYENIDVNGKIVLLFKGEPQEKDSSSFFDGVKMTDYSKPVNKVLNAIDHGAVGVIFINNPGRLFNRPPNPWPSLMRHPVKGAIPLTVGEKEENKIVVVDIGRKLGEKIFAAAGKSMKTIYLEIDKNLQPRSFEAPVEATIAVKLTAEKFWTQNVVGLLPGADPELKDEIVVIGGHYAHLGAKDDTTIFNGADDNASGTVGMMAIAKAFCSCPVKPARSILFMAFAGEEKGLFGSRYYVGTNPLFPLKKTVAMINLDMISRNDTSDVEIYGADHSPELKEAFLKVNEKIKMPYKIVESKKLRGGSDHQSFGRKNIPYLFFHTGLHEDYHKTTDTVEKISRSRMALVTKAAFGVAWLVANAKEGPHFVE